MAHLPSDKAKELSHDPVNIWYIDSGCSRHMTGVRSLLTDFDSGKKGRVSFAGAKGGEISGIGNVSNGTVTLKDVFFVEQLEHNLLSVSQICDLKNSVHFNEEAALILKPGFEIPEDMILMRAPRRKNTYILDMSKTEQESTCLLSKSTNDEAILWHRKMAHLHFRKINDIVKKGLVIGVPLKRFTSDDNCVSCKLGKQHKKTHVSKALNSIEKPFELLHTDLFGPVKQKSLGGKYYCLVVTDDFSRYSWVFFLATKGETVGKLITFFDMIKNVYNTTVKRLRSDNGTEFKNSAMQFYCLSNGIIQQFSAAYEPQQNGVAERKNRTLIEAARTMLADSHLPVTLWGEAVNTACYVLNRVLTVKRFTKTSYELLNNRKPNLAGLEPFGVPCTVLLNNYTSKFEPKAVEGYFLGYVEGCANKRVYLKNARKVEISFNVEITSYTFERQSGPACFFDYDSLFDSFNLSSFNDVSAEIDGHQSSSDDDDTFFPSIPVIYEPENVSTEAAPTTVAEDNPFHETADEETDIDQDLEETEATYDLSDHENTDNTLHETRINKSHPFKNIIGDPLAGVQTRTQLEGKYAEAIMSDDYAKCRYLCFLSQDVPANVHMALKDINWVHAMQEELAQFKKLGVWCLVELPEKEYPIGTKWVFRCKKDDRGIITRNKARLVVLGFYQEEGLDYQDVFAPVARLEAVRLFLAYASHMKFTVYQLDVKSAFLYGKLEETVYVQQPPGFEDPHHPNKVYKLNKALYGLHQAPRAWYGTLSNFLLNAGFKRGRIDSTLFIKESSKDILLVQVYVDDIIFGSTNVMLCKEFEKLMKEQFEMSAMGEMKMFLGLQVEQLSDGMFIHQSQYVTEILAKYNMSDCKNIGTPIQQQHNLEPNATSDPDVDPTLYRGMIGSLMYLTASRPDIMFAVCLCARFQACPKVSHQTAVKRILRYLRGRPRLGLWYPKGSDLHFEAYTDSDYGGCNINRKSTSGGCQFLGGRLVSWQCKKQTTVSVSSCEAEYIAAGSCVSQVLWIQQQMLDYGLSLSLTPIFIDNEAAISVIKNPVKHSKTRHIDFRHHFIRDYAEKKFIDIVRIASEDNLADLFTKAFDRSRFESLVQRIGMRNLE